jgi:hypothetical protein
MLYALCFYAIQHYQKHLYKIEIKKVIGGKPTRIYKMTYQQEHKVVELHIRAVLEVLHHNYTQEVWMDRPSF